MDDAVVGLNGDVAAVEEPDDLVSVETESDKSLTNQSNHSFSDQQADSEPENSLVQSGASSNNPANDSQDFYSHIPEDRSPSPAEDLFIRRLDSTAHAQHPAKSSIPLILSRPPPDDMFSSLSSDASPATPSRSAELRDFQCHGPENSSSSLTTMTNIAYDVSDGEVDDKVPIIAYPPPSENDDSKRFDKGPQTPNSDISQDYSPSPSEAFGDSERSSRPQSPLDISTRVPLTTSASSPAHIPSPKCSEAPALSPIIDEDSVDTVTTTMPPIEPTSPPNLPTASSQSLRIPPETTPSTVFDESLSEAPDKPDKSCSSFESPRAEEPTTFNKLDTPSPRKSPRKSPPKSPQKSAEPSPLKPLPSSVTPAPSKGLRRSQTSQDESEEVSLWRVVSLSSFWNHRGLGSLLWSLL